MAPDRAALPIRNYLPAAIPITKSAQHLVHFQVPAQQDFLELNRMKSGDLGYVIAPECLSSQECDLLLEALSVGSIARSRAGARHLMSVPAVAALANDARLTERAREWLGSPAIPFRATLFEKSQRYKLVDTLAPGYGASFDKETRFGW